MNIPLQVCLPQASRVVFGCMGLGGSWDQQPVADRDVAKAQAAVEAALEIGITVFDHADIYTRGKAEQCFGALFKRQPSLRDKMLLQSKCGIRFADGAGPKRYDLSADHIRTSVDDSLGRLNTEYLDVLILHRPDALMDPAEVARAWTRIKSEGKARHLGVSNMHAAQMQWLSEALQEPLAVNQLEMSLQTLDWLEAGTCFNDAQARQSLVWAGTLEHCQRHNIQVQAWGSMAKGWFSGGAPHDAPAAVHRTARLVQELAHRHQAPLESIVLAWVMKHPARIQPVIGTANPKRIRACADATRVVLSREEWYQLYETARGHELP